MSSLIVEGGLLLHRAFWDADLVDRVQMYVTPRRLGAEGLEWLPVPLPGLGPVRRPNWEPMCWSKQMFTGLIEAIGEVSEMAPSTAGFRLRLATPIATRNRTRR